MEQLTIPASITEKEERYSLLIRQIKSLLSKEDNVLSNLSNLTAALNDGLDYVSWVGFYLFDGEKLYLGPFQGKAACTEINTGSGVCGTAASKLEPVIVPDVSKFPGHIACDPGSKSEIVIPLIKKDGRLFGVLDLDSAFLNSFNETDKKNLEEICNYLINNILN
ncbi:free methionine-R-sulfoxide reductase [bacterium BMS3Abin03]|nr:free methionine-R-sulfoxide reductase [bacterium BMS3Abin03]